VDLQKAIRRSKALQFLATPEIRVILVIPVIRATVATSAPPAETTDSAKAIPEKEIVNVYFFFFCSLLRKK